MGETRAQRSGSGACAGYRDQVALSSARASDVATVWRPAALALSSSHCAFSRLNGAGSFNLYTITPSGSGLRRLTYRGGESARQATTTHRRLERRCLPYRGGSVVGIARSRAADYGRGPVLEQTECELSASRGRG